MVAIRAVVSLLVIFHKMFWFFYYILKIVHQLSQLWFPIGVSEKFSRGFAKRFLIFVLRAKFVLFSHAFIDNAIISTLAVLYLK